METLIREKPQHSQFHCRVIALMQCGLGYRPAKIGSSQIFVALEDPAQQFRTENLHL